MNRNNIMKYILMCAVLVACRAVCSDVVDYQRQFNELSVLSDKTPTDYYNMGVCAHHLAKPYEAAVFWNYASSIADAQLAERIDQCMKQAQCCTIQFEQKKAFDFARQISLFWVQIVAIMLALLLIGICLKAPRFLLPAWIACLLALLLVGILYYVRSDSPAVIKEPCSMRVGPGHSYMKSSQLSQGVTVAILEQHKSWYKVQSSKEKGWIEEIHLIRI